MTSHSLGQGSLCLTHASPRVRPPPGTRARVGGRAWLTSAPTAARPCPAAACTASPHPLPLVLVLVLVLLVLGVPMMPPLSRGRAATWCWSVPTTGGSSTGRASAYGCPRYGTQMASAVNHVAVSRAWSVRIVGWLPAHICIRWRAPVPPLCGRLSSAARVHKSQVGGCHLICVQLRTPQWAVPPVTVNAAKGSYGASVPTLPCLHWTAPLRAHPPSLSCSLAATCLRPTRDQRVVVRQG